MSNGLNRIDELDEVQQLRAELASAQQKYLDYHEWGLRKALELKEANKANASLRAENEALRSNAEAQTKTVAELKDFKEIIDNLVRMHLLPMTDLQEPTSIPFAFKLAHRNYEALRAQHAQDAVELDSGNAARKERDELKARLEETINDLNAHLGNGAASHECQVDKYRSALKDAVITLEAAEARANEAEAKLEDCSEAYEMLKQMVLIQQKYGSDSAPAPTAGTGERRRNGRGAMKTGDRVCVIESPYSSVRNGTIATIKEVVLNHFGRGRHMYVLADLPNQIFREHEIKKVEK